jgi:hypothetical protein
MIAVLGIVPLSIVFWIFLGDALENSVHYQTFNDELWKKQSSSAHDVKWPARLRMVDDLLASGRLIGMSKNQVIELLGPPDGTQDAGVSYYLGPERGPFGIDSETLIIEFGEDAIFCGQKIHRD